MKSHLHKKYVFIYLTLFLAYIFETLNGSRNIVFLLFSIFLPYMAIVNSNRELIRIITPLICVAVFSIPGTIHYSQQFESYKAIRDVFYLLQAPIIIYVGGIIFLQLKTMMPVVHGFIIISTFASAFMLFGALVALSGGASFADIRYNNPYYTSAPITLFILIFASELSGKCIITKRSFNILASISVAAIILSFSRLQYLTVLITLLLFSYQLTYYGDSRSRKKISFFFVSLFVGLLAINSVTQIFESQFIDKLERSMIELFAFGEQTVGREIELWRAYEIVLISEKFRSADLLTVCFGYGLGSGVVLPFSASENLQAGDLIPIFHNSFGTVVLKSGIIGLAAYCFFFLKIFYNVMRKPSLQSPHSTDKLFGRLVAAGIFVLIFNSAFATHGLYTNSVPYPALLLLGSSLLAMRAPDTQGSNNGTSNFITGKRGQ